LPEEKIAPKIMAIMQVLYHKKVGLQVARSLYKAKQRFLLLICRNYETEGQLTLPFVTNKNSPFQLLGPESN
jgi:hypothetical protein